MKKSKPVFLPSKEVVPMNRAARRHVKKATGNAAPPALSPKVGKWFIAENSPSPKKEKEV